MSLIVKRACRLCQLKTLFPTENPHLDPRERCFFESDEVGLHDLNVISIAVQDTSS